MSLSMGILTFLNVWCLTLFFVLAFSVQAEPNATPQDYAAAPRAIQWKRKLLMNTAISLVLTLIIAVIVKSGVIPVKDFFVAS